MYINAIFFTVEATGQTTAKAATYIMFTAMNPTFSKPDS